MPPMSPIATSLASSCSQSTTFLFHNRLAHPCRRYRPPSALPPASHRGRLCFVTPGNPAGFPNHASLTAHSRRGDPAHAVSGDSGTGEDGLTEDVGGGGVGIGGEGGEGYGSGGGGGGGGEDPKEEGADSEGGERNKMEGGMSMSQKITLGYAALVGVGGLMGYLKSGSQKSLAAGGSSALLLYLVYTQLPVRPALASSLGLGLSAALLVVMGSRFRKSGKIFPAGVVSLVSLVMVGGYFHGILRSLHT